MLSLLSITRSFKVKFLICHTLCLNCIHVIVSTGTPWQINTYNFIIYFNGKYVNTFYSRFNSGIVIPSPIYDCYSKPIRSFETLCVILTQQISTFPLSSLTLSLLPLSPYSLSPPWRSAHQHWFIIYSCAWETSSYWFNAYSNPALYPLLVRDAGA